MKKRLAALLTTVFLLAGCSGPDGEIYGEKKVREHVNEICTEPYTLVGTELIAETPDNMRYDFVTDGRGLSFSANSTLVPITFDASVSNFYTKRITCDYVSAVHELYREDVKAALCEAENYLQRQGYMYLLSFNDIDAAVDTLLSADRIYAEELNWNSPEFLRKNSITRVHFIWNRSLEEAQENETWVNITDIRLTGQLTRQALYDELANRYAQLYVDGRIEKGDDIPQEYLEGKHVTSLNTFTLNGDVMAYDNKDNPYNRFGLTTDDYLRCWYSYEADAYLLPIDIGYMNDQCSFPLILREYALALGGTYERETNGDQSVSRWTVGNDSWMMISRLTESEITQLRVSKNGIPLELDWYTSDQEIKVAATFCVALSLGDFCQLFNLSYSVDEAAGVLAFTPKMTVRSQLPLTLKNSF